MANPKVHICGHPKIYVPDDDCSECIQELNLFKDEVHENYYTKTETDDLLDDKQGTLTAGANITIDENNVISASGGGGGSYTAGDYIDITGDVISVDMTKADLLTLLGYEEITLAMTDTDGTEHEWTILAQIPTP